MAERIDLPPTLQGDEKAQLQQVWSYLYQLSEAINNNLDAIGGNELTDKERQSMQQILQAAGVTQDGVSTDYETLKSLIIKTADFVQTSLQEYRMKLLGETVASGQFGRYVRQTGLDVEVTPEGITQNYSLREIAEDLKHYEVNAKNYIKTGLLRTVSSIPVYGVAIGKDVVTFSQDGTETYNDGNKVAELTADELSFWQGGVKVAGYTGSKISFYYNGTEAFYIQNGKLYSTNDIQLSAGKKVIMGKWSIDDGGIVYKDTQDPIGFEIANYTDRDANTTGIFYENYIDQYGNKCGRIVNRVYEAEQNNNSYSYRGVNLIFEIEKRSDEGSEMWETKLYPELEGGTWTNFSYLGDTGKIWDGVFTNILIPGGNHVGSIGSKTRRYEDAYLDYIRGGFSWEETSELNMNNMTEPGHYYFSNLYSITGKPSDLSNENGYLEVIRSQDIYERPYIQKLYAKNNIYIRTGRLRPATVSSWYRFSGTAV